MSDTFPAPVYKETVLAPLFEGVKRHHWRHQMQINYAHAVMLGERGLLSPAELRAILDALKDIVAGLDLERLTYTGEHEDFFFWVEAELKARVGIEVAGKLHTGRSRNDMDHTVFKMALKERLIGFGDALAGLVETLIRTAEANHDTLVVAYTHGQPAQPTSWGHYLGALIEVLLRDLDRLLHAFGTVDRSSMGAAAITTSGFGLDRARVAELLGFGQVQENSYGCIAACDYATHTYAAMKLLFINLGRFVQDLNQWTSFETGHLHVPDGFVQISSIMPQKRNPVPIEHLRLICSLGAGRADTIVNTMHNTPFTDMNDCEGEVHIAGYEAFEAGHRAVALLGGLIAACRIDQAKVRRHIEEARICMTELADSLVRHEGLSFRQAHEIAAHLSRTEVSFAAFTAKLGRPPRISEAEFRHFLTPEHFVAVRDMPGGPAALPVSLARYREELATRRGEIAAHRDRVARAEADVARLIA